MSSRKRLGQSPSRLCYWQTSWNACRYEISSPLPPPNRGYQPLEAIRALNSCQWGDSLRPFPNCRGTQNHQRVMTANVTPCHLWALGTSNQTSVCITKGYYFIEMHSTRWIEIIAHGKNQLFFHDYERFFHETPSNQLQFQRPSKGFSRAQCRVSLRFNNFWLRGV